MSKWSSWVKIEEAKSKKGRFNQLGIYQIRVVSSSGEPIAVSRLVGVDPLGIVYIGRSGYDANRSIATRIGEFVKQHHSGGMTYARAKRILKKEPRFSGHCLEVSVLFLSDKAAIESAESRTLLRYFAEYGELPPCNSVRSQVRQV